MPSVHEVNHVDELSSCRLLWNSLLEQTEGATFFQSLDWLETYWRHYGSGQKLRVLIVVAAGRPIGILPLVVRTEPTRVGPVRVLTYPLHDWGSFYGPIGPNPTATLHLGLQHVASTDCDWDLLDLRWVNHDLGRTSRAMQRAGFSPKEQPWTQTALVEMTGSWEEYWESRPKAWRQNVDRLGRRLSEQGEITHVRYRPEGAACGDGDPRWDLYDACVELSEKSWQGSSTTGTTLCHESVEEYFRETHAKAAKTGSLDLNLLLVDGKPAAFAYNYRRHQNMYGLRKGFDPCLAKFGAGNVLQQMMLQDSFRRGDRQYDLGIGYRESKQQWMTSLAVSYRYTHFPAACRAQLLRLKRWFQDRLSTPAAIVASRSA